LENSPGFSQEGDKKLELRKSRSLTDARIFNLINIQDKDGNVNVMSGTLRHSQSLVRIPAGKEFAGLLKRDWTGKDIEFVHPVLGVQEKGESVENKAEDDV
jgi:hypothetical protein